MSEILGGDATGPVLLGVTPQQPELVLDTALRLARTLRADLVCAQVDASSYVVEEHADGSVDARPLDPDQPDWTSSPVDPGLADRVRTSGEAYGVHVEVRALAGDVAEALGHLAETLGAELIVVGSRPGGVRASMHDFFGGSIAVHLIHRQPRPVLVVPVDPSPAGSGLPWEEAP